MSTWIWIKKFFPQDEPEPVTAGISRRSFIRNMIGAGVGVATGIVAPPVKIFLPPQKVFSPYIHIPIGQIPASGLEGILPPAEAFLRPLQQPLYDTEIIPPSGQSLMFFQRPLGVKLVPGKSFAANVLWNSSPREEIVPTSPPWRLERV